MNTLEFFSSEVPEAERKFKAACSSAKLKVAVHDSGCLDPNGNSVNTLVCRVGSMRARDLMLVISGTHGIEGYSGAAIQHGIISNIGKYSIPSSLAIVMVHIINPWGCAWDRRENEDNIDIYRNLLYSDPPYADYSEYDIIADAICPSMWSGPVRTAAEEKLREYERVNGEGSVIAVARRGQNRHPRGLTYHGRSQSWSKKTINSIARAHIGDAERLVICDIHTGYGSYGVGALVSFQLEGTLMDRRLIEWFGSDILRPGIDPLIPMHSGLAYDYLGGMYPKVELTSYGIEFGTRNVRDNFDILREASWLFNYGDPLSKEGKIIRKSYRNLFYPEHDDWKQQIWNRGEEVFMQTLAGLARENSGRTDDIQAALDLKQELQP